MFLIYLLLFQTQTNAQRTMTYATQTHAALMTLAVTVVSVRMATMATGSIAPVQCMNLLSVITPVQLFCDR